MSAVGVTIRPARLEDVGAVVALERGVAEAPHWAEREYGAMVESSAGEGVRRCLLVAESGGELAGFAVGRAIGREEVSGELESVAVATGARRAGTGRALCEAVIAWSRGQGADAVELEVRSANHGAIALYERLGFVRVGMRKGYYREPADDAVLMRIDVRG
ncbi:GNAT family N-acetyltransferase [Edaphobacter aggregans]|uniref:GNAT family N-acetyltransferase n=1 Tax=Edaphobacter aggregans TaxID=570835 RepID=UPI000553A70A|nr:GNAT family N-acetyltransferase [Edaphobacter aggregans]